MGKSEFQTMDGKASPSHLVDSASLEMLQALAMTRPEMKPQDQSCASCRHWRRLLDNQTLRARTSGGIGTCQAFPPTSDFHFTRTSAVDICGCHEPPESKPDVTALRAKRTRIGAL
jgi:hypothetical protein